MSVLESQGTVPSRIGLSAFETIQSQHADLNFLIRCLGFIILSIHVSKLLELLKAFPFPFGIAGSLTTFSPEFLTFQSSTWQQQQRHHCPTAWQRQGSDGIYCNIRCFDERTGVANNPRVHLDSIITEGGPFSDPDADLGQGTIARLEAAKVLLVSILDPPSPKPPTDHAQSYVRFSQDAFYRYNN